MGGKGDECVDSKEWPPKNQFEFIRILNQHVKDQKMQSRTFKQKVWEQINDQLEAVVGEKYGIDRLKRKFNRLRKQHREFSELLLHTGVTYNTESNIVEAAEDVWQMFYKKNKSFRQFRKKGLDDYQLLCEIFKNTVATGKLHHASMQKPPTSSKEHEIEDEFLSNSMHVNLSNVGDTAGDDDIECQLRSGLKRKASSASVDRCAKTESKIARMKSCLEAWSRSLISKEEARKAKAKKYKVQSGTSEVSDPYSIEECMDILESIDGLEFTYFNKALERFKDPDWRKMFVKMSAQRRRQWLESLV